MPAPLAIPALMKILIALFAAKEGADVAQNYIKQRGDVKLGKEQLALERKKMETESKGTEMAYKEQRAMAKEAYGRAKIEKGEDRQMAREDRVFQLSNDSANRQTAMMLSMIQNIMGANQGIKPDVTGIPSIPELLR